MHPEAFRNNLSIPFLIIGYFVIEISRYTGGTVFSCPLHAFRYQIPEGLQDFQQFPAVHSDALSRDAFVYLLPIVLSAVISEIPEFHKIFVLFILPAILFQIPEKLSQLDEHFVLPGIFSQYFYGLLKHPL